MQPWGHRADRPLWERVWSVVKPPPTTGSGRRKLSRRQWKILGGILAAVLAAAAGAGVYSYYASAADRAEARFQEGMRLMAPGTYAQAVEQFDQAIAAWSGHAQAYLQRGQARQILGQSAKALSDFGEAVERDPSLAEAHTARGTILRERGDTRGAIREFTRSIELRPTLDGYYQRGQLWARLGEHGQAIEDFDQAIALGRMAPYVYRARGESKRALGDIDGYQQDRDTAQSIEHKF